MKYLVGRPTPAAGATGRIDGWLADAVALDLPGIAERGAVARYL